MTSPLLVSWWRRRMIALVVVSSAAAGLAPPATYAALRHRETLAGARAEAERVAAIIAESVRQRPLLWRYDAAKIADRVAAGGRGLPVAVRDGQGAVVGLGGATDRRVAAAIWGRVHVVVGGERVATVWAAQDAAPLWRGALLVAALSAAVAAAVGAFLYRLPARAVAEAERRVGELEAALRVATRDEERGRIARDLHDGAGQALTAARLDLVALRRGAGPEQAEALGRVAAFVDDALDEVRRSTSALMPPAIAELGLRGALERHCETFAAAAGIAIACDVDPGLSRLPGPVATACYRIVQEALGNVVRHAGASRAEVDVRAQGGGVRLVVRDDGATRPREPRPAGGFGLRSVEDRARALGGRAMLRQAERGSILEVTLPIDEGGS